jgi:ADP-L-glycero-D-manno-heptose 6-epimerase
MKFIVTGGAGLIGSNIIIALNNRGETDILVVDNLTPAKEKNLLGLNYAEYMDKIDFRKEILAGKIPKAETVFHLGACSSTTETNEEYLNDNNFLYTKQLCQWCLQNETRFIYASSAATYGDGSLGYSDADDITPSLKPLNLYGESKQAFDMWALENKLLNRIVGLKYFNVYGPNEDHKGPMRSVINKAYSQIKETGEIGLFKSYRPEYRDGEQERDFVYVRDAVAVTLFFHDNKNVSGLYNCGTGKARTWIDLAKALFAAMKITPNISFVDMPEEIRDKYQYHTQADNNKLYNAGYTSDWTSIEDGVKDYVESYLNKK